MNTYFLADATLLRRFGWLVVLALVTGSAFECSFGMPTAAAQESPRPVEALADDVKVDFAVDIAPILKQNCLACHHQKEAEGGLVLESHASIIAGGDSGAGVTSGDASGSTVFTRAVGGEDDLMPPPENEVGAKPLTPRQLGLLKRWIETGAEDSAVAVGSINWQAIPESISPIYALAASPEGRFVAANFANRVKVIDTQRNQVVAELHDPDVAAQTGQAAAALDLVQSVAYSPDGDMIATGDFQRVRLWRRRIDEVDPPKLPWQIEAAVLAMSADGGTVGLVDADGGIEIWDVKSGEMTHQFPPLELPTVSIAVGTGGKTIATSTADGAVAVFTVSEDKLEPIASKLLSESAVSDFCFLSQPANVIAVARRSGGVDLIDHVSDKKIRSLESDPNVVRLRSLSDARQLITVDRAGVICRWSIETGKLVATLSGDPVTESRMRRLTADASRQSAAVKRMTAKTESLTKLLTKEDEAVQKLEKPRDEAAEKVKTATEKQQAAADKVIATQKRLAEAIKQAEAEKLKLEKEIEADKKAAADSEAETLKANQELAKRQTTLDAAIAAQKQASAAIPAHEASLKQVTAEVQATEKSLAKLREKADSRDGKPLISVSPDQQWLAVSVDTDKIRLYPADGTGTVAAVYAETPLQMWFGPDNNLVTRDVGGAIKAWSPTPTWKLHRTIGNVGDDTISDRVTALSFYQQKRLAGSADGDVADEKALGAGGELMLAVGSGPPSRFGDIKVFSAATGDLRDDIGQIHSDSVLSLQFTGDGSKLISSAADKTIRVIDLASNSVVRSLDGHTHHVLAVAWHPTEPLIASASADKTVKVWNAETGIQTRTISGFGGEVTSIAFIAGTTNIATTCGDGTARIHKTDNGSQVRLIKAGNDFQYGLAITPDGTRLITGGESGTIRLWNVADGKSTGEVE